MMLRRLTRDAIKQVLTLASAEARRRGDRRIGTAHLLLAILHDPESKAARALGVDLAAARAAEVALDRNALAAVGIDAGGIEFPAETEDQRSLLPLTSGARAALKRAIDHARPAKTGWIDTTDFLFALLVCETPDPAAALFQALGVNVSALSDRLSRSVHGSLK